MIVMLVPNGWSPVINVPKKGQGPQGPRVARASGDNVPIFSSPHRPIFHDTGLIGEQILIR